jgi:hypothetical protein
VSAGYTGKPIYLCTEALTEKKTYGSSQCPFTCRCTEKEYEYREGLCPRAEEALRHLICIPLNESWKKGDVKRAVSAVEKSIRNMASKEVALSGEIRERGRSARSVSLRKREKIHQDVGFRQRDDGIYDARKQSRFDLRLPTLSSTGLNSLKIGAKEYSRIWRCWRIFRLDRLCLHLLS